MALDGWMSGVIFDLTGDGGRATLAVADLIVPTRAGRTSLLVS
jgi:hypothetical protein